ncbi:hypothetical protein D3C80_2002240 [compost metagenome]
MIEMAKHGISMWRATITSGMVDIPTASAPIARTYPYSAGVSNVGPVKAAYVPTETLMLFSAAMFFAKSTIL